ncbi:hypothetical protein GF380_02100, partial [Candidatus Uhrbacteria bacterium]|nr:hypothetical protein [Candidatus Uhrbacteria bacterium]
MKYASGRSLLPIARYWWGRGVVPVPMYWKSKRPAFAWGQWAQRFPDWREVEAEFDTRLHRGIGLLTGAVSGGLVVLDFDKVLDYVRWRRRVDIETYTVQTARGFHVYLRMQEPPGRTMMMRGGEIKGSGYVVAPPSVHVSGVPYQQWGDANEVLSVRNIEAASIETTLPEIVPERHTGGLPDIPQAVVPESKDDVVAKIKQSLPLEDLLRKYTRLIPSGPGGWFKCCCPFHDDHTPSM